MLPSWFTPISAMRIISFSGFLPNNFICKPLASGDHISFKLNKPTSSLLTPLTVVAANYPPMFKIIYHVLVIVICCLEDKQNILYLYWLSLKVISGNDLSQNLALYG